MKNSFDALAAELARRDYDVEVTSGWRSEENNRRNNGAENSKYLGTDGYGTGQAIDFIIHNEFEQAEIEALAKQFGMQVLYQTSECVNKTL